MTSSFDALDAVANSPLFDPAWYVRTYPDVDRSGLEPARHYLWVGGKIGRDPGPEFNTRAYLEAHDDVQGSGLNPLVHYERHGRAEGRPITASEAALPQDAAPSPEAAPLPAALETAEMLSAFEEAIAGTRDGLGFTRWPSPALRAVHNAPSDPRRAYAVVTPTGDRAALFNRCLHMVTSQTVPPHQWVVVDDGIVPLSAQIDLPDWITYVRRPRHPADPPHTLSVNMLAALDHITEDKVLIMEDDDWYAPIYAAFMLPYLDTAGLVGLNKIRYYHLPASMWKTATPPEHTAFAQSAFCRGHAWDHLAAVCRTNFTEIREKGVLDRHWWHTFEGQKHLIQDHPCLHVGLKGGFGRPGLAHGHSSAEVDYIPDPDQTYLTKSIGPDIAYYARWQRTFRKPYVLYTCAGPNGALPDVTHCDLTQCDLFAFSGTPLPEGTPWQAVPFDAQASTPAAQGRLPRALPHLYFPDYDWSLWVEPGTPVPADPATWIARTIDQRAEIALPAGPVPDLPPAPGPDTAAPERIFTRYLATQGESTPPFYQPRIMVRRHTSPGLTQAMTTWLRLQRTGEIDGPAALTYALWHAGLTPAQLELG